MTQQTTILSLVLALLLGAIPAQAAEVFFDDGGTKATRIEDLNINGTLYDVTFDVQVFANQVYGTFPGTFTFNTETDALAAIDAINAALNEARATSVGEPGSAVQDLFVDIGYDSFLDNLEQWVNRVSGGCKEPCADEFWERVPGGSNPVPYNDQVARTWAKFTVVGDPDQFTLTVNKAGDGSGTVTSAPSGINCGSSCSAEFASDTIVTLTAAPAVGSQITSWSGCDSHAQDECNVIMTQARTVTATFEKGITPAPEPFPWELFLPAITNMGEQN